MSALPPGGDAFPAPTVVVGVGASAGGLDAFGRFVDTLPPESGMAFVLVQHLDPHHASELADLIQARTSMPVTQVMDRTPVEPDHLYVIAPGTELGFEGGDLVPTPLPDDGRRRVPVDLFFRSLAHDRGRSSVCVVLSGSGSDGSVGLKSVKEVGGLVLVQSPDDAEYDGMPLRAIATGLPDLVAPVEELAERLVESVRAGERLQDEAAFSHGLLEEELLARILSRVRNVSSHDFSHYKRSTILRRIGRRMQVNLTDDFESYYGLLMASEEETEALFRDFLISVTNFFRNPEVFTELEHLGLPRIFEGRPADETVRVWVPGCSTGEEAYSLAMLLEERAESLESPPSFRIFATDIDRDALAVARRGFYPEAIVADVSPERLLRHFRREGNGYSVREELRERVLFTPHDLLRDPPFGHVDLVSCRNLLIYLEREVQRKVFRTFQHALRPGGLLLLGRSESADGRSERFRPLGGATRLYERLSGPAGPPPVDVFDRRPRRPSPAGGPPEDVFGGATLGELHRQALLRAYAPPSVLIDREYDLLHLSGGVDRYLHRPDGEPLNDLMRAVVPELRVELRTTVFHAFQAGQRQSSRPVALGDGGSAVRVRVQPVLREGSAMDYAVVVFEPVSAEDMPSAEGDDADPAERDVVARLEDELRETRDRMRSVVEESESSEEELRASNEELQSMNEELRSTTEELETSREELQSTNEELHIKIQELRRANGDLRNLMVAIDLATVFVDRDLNVSRFTDRATDLFDLSPADLGRPLAHVSHRLEEVRVEDPAREVLSTLATIQREVRGGGRWWVMRLQPYRSLADEVEGVVLTFTDITEQKRNEEELAIRSAQRTALAELGRLALEEIELEEFFDEVVRRVAEAVDVEFCELLEHRPEHGDLILRAGIGWKEGYVGQATVEDALGSQAGYTLSVDGSVVVTELDSETRFEPPNLLTDHEVRSGMTVLIPGPRPFGVLGAHTAARRRFSQDDIRLLESVANLLGDAVRNWRAEAELREAVRRAELRANELEAVLESVPGGLYIGDATGIHRCNRRALEMVGATGIEQLQGDPETVARRFKMRDPYTREPLSRDEHPFALALRGMRASREVLAYHRATEENIYLRVSAAPIFDGHGEVVGAVGINSDITEARRREERLRAQEKELQEAAEKLEERVRERTDQVRRLAHELTMAEQRERRRIALVLHDDLQQLLYALQTKLHVLADLEPERREAVLGRIDDLLERAIEVTRTLTVDLSPPVLKNDTLTDALSWLGVQMKDVHGLEVSVEREGESPDLSDEMRTLLFNFGRELLFNVVKYAGTDAAQVRVKSDGDTVVVRVEDRGSGFDPSERANRSDLMERDGFGLASIRERLAMFGGSLDIDSAPGKGTRVTVTAPLRAPEVPP